MIESEDPDLFHHGFLVPARVPALVLFFSFLSFLRIGVPFHPNFLVLPISHSGSRTYLPSSLVFLFSDKGSWSIMISWFFVGSGACLPSPSFFCFPQTALELTGVLTLLAGDSLCSIIISWSLLVRALVPVLVYLLFSFSFFRKK